MTDTKLKKIAVILGDPTRPDPIKPGNKFDQDDKETVEKLKEALAALEGYQFDYFDKHKDLFYFLKEQRKETYLAFNLCDEGYMNDPKQEGYIPVMLDFLRIPYTGAGKMCMVKCYNKFLVKKMAEKRGIQIPNGVMINEKKDLEKRFIENYPVIVKTNYGDGSLNINQKSVANNFPELEQAVLELCQVSKDPILIEEFLNGDDITFGVIGNPGSFELLPLIKEDYSGLPKKLVPICGREAKWDEKSLYYDIHPVLAELSGQAEKEIVNGSLTLFKALECRDYARFDWRLNSKGIPKLLEINPNPGWCWDGHLARAALFKKISYPEMLNKILNAAEKRLNIH